MKIKVSAEEKSSSFSSIRIWEKDKMQKIQAALHYISS